MAKTPTNFRLSEDTINQLDYIAKEMSLDGRESNKTEAIEVSVIEKAERMGYKEETNKEATA
jgi:hypothetical protein